MARPMAAPSRAVPSQQTRQASTAAYPGAASGQQVQKAYIAKYGANEKGWMKPTGSLPQ